MKTEYKYLEFKQIPSKDSRRKFICRNKKVGGELGEIRWFSDWKQYCFFPTVQAIYSSDCLNDIADFINHLEF